MNEIKRQVCEIWSRTCGYYRPIKQMNDAKQSEHKDKKYFDMKDALGKEYK
jgi:anaerobic ribonucleoside-triphosphate reductase